MVKFLQIALLGLFGCKSSQPGNLNAARTAPVGADSVRINDSDHAEDEDLSEIVVAMTEGKQPSAHKSNQASGEPNASPEYMWVKADHLHVRSGPSVQEKIVGYVRKGIKVHIKTPGPWSMIKEGYWVNSKWLSPSPVNSP